MKPYLLSLPPAVSPSLSLSLPFSLLSLSRSPLPTFPGRPPAPPFPGRPQASPSPAAHGLEASTGSSISMHAGSSFPTRASGRIRLGAERGVEQDELAGVGQDELVGKPARRIERGARAGRPPRARPRGVGRGGCRDSSQRTATISLNLLPQQLLPHPSRHKRVHLRAWGGRTRQGRGGYVSNLEFLRPIWPSTPIWLGYVSPAYPWRIRISVFHSCTCR